MDDDLCGRCGGLGMCPACRGQGWVMGGRCTACEGSGVCPDCGGRGTGREPARP